MRTHLKRPLVKRPLVKRPRVKRLLGAGLGAGLGLAVGLGASGAALAEVESKDPIKLTLHDWTGQLITTKLMGSVLQKAGYNVESVQADQIAQFAGLKTGDLHIAMELWGPTGREELTDATAPAHGANRGTP